MFVIALAAAVASVSPSPEQRTGTGAPLIQATATVRIVAGARISATAIPNEALVRDTRVTGPDGVKRDARLIEFP
jgi:hypothetical protein